MIRRCDVCGELMTYKTGGGWHCRACGRDTANIKYSWSDSSDASKNIVRESAGGSSGGKILRNREGVVNMENLEKNDICCDSEDCIHGTADGGCRKGCVIIQDGRCQSCEQRIMPKTYTKITGTPRLGSEVYVTVGGGVFYKAFFLGYGDYDLDRREVPNDGRAHIIPPPHNTYCVQVVKSNGSKFVDYFLSVYSMDQDNKDDEGEEDGIN